MKGIELARKVYESFEKDDLAGVISCLAEDVEWELVGPPSIPYFGNFRGHGGVQRFFDLLYAEEEVIEFHPEQYIDGGDSVVVTGRERCRARATGKEYATRWAHVFDCENGKIVRWREFIDTAPMVSAYV